MTQTDKEKIEEAIKQLDKEFVKKYVRCPNFRRFYTRFLN